MKAINFLEWCKNQDTSFRSVTGVAMKSACVVNQNILDFYSTPFRPELITEYFMAWEVFEDNFMKQWRDKEGNYFEAYTVTYGFTSYKTEQEMILPQANTLNDFISDCQRAGIELTFKPEIVERYFK